MNPLMIVRLKGTQAEMGRQYGELALRHDEDEVERAREVMSTLSARLLTDANHRTLGGRLTKVAIMALLERGRRRMERLRPADYRDRGIAFMEAAGLPAEAGRHLVLMDVFQSVIGLAGRLSLGPFGATHRALETAGVAAVRRTIRPTPACSSLAVWGAASEGGDLRHGRNFDFPCIGLWDKSPTVVFCEPDDGLRYGYVGAFGLDVPGCTGFNEAGITVAAHTRFHREASFEGASVVDVCHELTRRAESLADAERILADPAHRTAAPWGLMVTSARESAAAVFETTGRRMVRLDPATGAEHLACTNWHRHPDTEVGQVAPYPTWPEHSDTRWRRLEQIATERPAATQAGGSTDGLTDGLTGVDVMRALGDHTDPHTGAPRAAGGCVGQSDTVTSVVFDSAAQHLFVSTGDAPTSWGPYREVPWSWDGLPGAFDAPSALGAPLPAAVAPRHAPPAGGADAHELWTAATRADIERHDADELLPLVEQAAEVGGAASYHFIAGVLRLRAADLDKAKVQLAAAASLERTPFRKAQALLWLARTCDALNEPEEAAAHRRELRSVATGASDDAATPDASTAAAPHIDSILALARTDEERGKPWPLRRFRRLTFSLELVDAAL